MIALVAATLMLLSDGNPAPIHQTPPRCFEFWERWDIAAAVNNEEELDRLMLEGEAIQCDTHSLLGEGAFE